MQKRKQAKNIPQSQQVPKLEKAYSTPKATQYIQHICTDGCAPKNMTSISKNCFHEIPITAAMLRGEKVNQSKNEKGWKSTYMSSDDIRLQQTTGILNSVIKNLRILHFVLGQFHRELFQFFRKRINFPAERSKLVSRALVNFSAITAEI